MKKHNRHKLPAPGLQGDYRGSCVVCLQGCDTALMLEGEAEWIIAGLMHLGIADPEEATSILTHDQGCHPGHVPDGILSPVVKLCESCLKKSGSRMQVGVMVSGTLPCYQPQRSY